MLESQKTRALAPEMDSLKIGMGWSCDDLEKPQILLESTFADSHPGSAHLFELVSIINEAVTEAGGKGARYFASDICDGMAQGHDGINYSLASRDTIANLIEIHARASTFDAGVFIASCDKAVPAHLMAIGRLNIPSIMVTGGVMNAGPDMLTLEQLGKYSAMHKRGEITDDQFAFYKKNACPSCGACSFMGTASTMQVLSEALGLMLPGTSLMPATSKELRSAAFNAGTQVLKLLKMGLSSRDILSEKSFENAIVVHAAISGSSNALLHLPAIASEAGIKIDAASFDRLHRGALYLADIRPAGKYPAQYFFASGGLPRLMENIKSRLHLDVLTVTGRTLGENLEDIKKSGFYEKCDALLQEAAKENSLKITHSDVIRNSDNPIGKDGTIAVLFGNLSPEGAVLKHSACPKEMFKATLRARPYNCEEDAIEAVLKHKIKGGDALIIRYEGPKGSGMPEMFYTTEAIASDPAIASSIALITDGRFSGASKGPAIGHVLPEAASGGPIALLEEGDLIELDIPERKLNIVGLGGKLCSCAEVAAALAKRKAAWSAPKPKYTKGVMKAFTQNVYNRLTGQH